MLSRLRKIVTIVFTMFAGMYGGQKNKATRRFGIPFFAFFMSLGDGFDWKDCSMFLMIPILCMGYGENSHLMQLIGNETLVRIAYAILLSIPFLFYGIRRFGVAVIVLIIAFQVRASSLGQISWFGDILIEDICRYGTLGILIAFNIFKEK